MQGATRLLLYRQVVVRVFVYLNYAKQCLTKRVVVSLRNAALIPQLLHTLTINGVSVSVVKSGYKYIAGGDVTLVMEQSFTRRKHLNIQCDVLLRDEYHVGCMGGVYIAMREELIT